MSTLPSAANRRTAGTPPPALAALTALIALTALAACGTMPDHSGRSRDAHRGAVALACTTTVHGVVEGPGSLAAAWLPPGYRQQGGASPASSLPDSTFAKATGQPDPPRIMLSSGHQTGPVTGADGGTGTGIPVRVQGHQGLIESGPPAPQLVGVYWKPSKGYLVSVIGYKVPRSTVLRVAQHVSFALPGIIALPVTPGRILTRQAAITTADRATGAHWRHAAAKLSSWTEVAAVAMRALTLRTQQILATPPALAGSPWRPVWVVLLTGPAAPAATTAVVLDAASGQVEDTIHVRGPWYSALSDRDPASGGCPGGSSARVPFGVLTRSEEEYPRDAGPAVQHARWSAQYVLSTVPAVNLADPGLYGGCIEQNCSIDQLVWVTIATVRADPGKTVACLPGSVSVPPGYKPRQVTEYYSVSVPGNHGIGCGDIPRRLKNLTDLAPPAAPSGRGS